MLFRGNPINKEEESRSGNAFDSVLPLLIYILESGDKYDVSWSTEKMQGILARTKSTLL